MTHSFVKSLTTTFLGQAIAALVIGAPMVAALPGSAAASQISATQLPVYSASLDDNWGGPLDQVTQAWGGAVVNGTIYGSKGAVQPSGLTEAYNTGSAAYQVTPVATSISPTMFAYEYSFTVSATSNPQGTFISNFGGLTNISLALYKGAPTLFQMTPATGTNPQGASVLPLDVGVYNGLTGTSGQYILQMAGLTSGQTYYLTATGQLAPHSSSGNFFGIAEVSAVPLPAALVMLGSALVGLGGVKERRRLGDLMRTVAHQTWRGAAVMAALVLALTMAFATGAKAAAVVVTDHAVITGTAAGTTTYYPFNGLIVKGSPGTLQIAHNTTVAAPANMTEFVFEYQFTLGSGVTGLTASLSQLHTTLTTGSSFELFAGAAPASFPASSPPKPLSVSSASAVPGELYLTYAGPAGTGVGKGTYYLAAMGNLATSATLRGSLSGTMAVSAVPLPAALLLFGSAIGGLAVAERFGRRRDQTA